MEEEYIAILVSANEYAYHIGQVVGVGSENLRVVRKKFSISTPYAIELVPLSGLSRVEYKSGLVPLRIAAGVFVIVLLLGIIYYLGVFWYQLESGTTIRVGLLGLAGIYGLKWAFMSRRHEFVFHFHDTSRLKWHSRSGDYKHKQAVVDKVLEFLRNKGTILSCS
jgi:hypothetical protein